jgi:hypothetical protein
MVAMCVCVLFSHHVYSQSTYSDIHVDVLLFLLTDSCCIVVV